jgi:hypothetical protein
MSFAMLLDFLNLGGAEIAIVVFVILLPTLLIIYCIVDISRSTFKLSIMKWLFLALVLFAPFIGSIIYLVMNKPYKSTLPNRKF